MHFAGTSRFKTVRLLGSGGMGTVHLVYDENLKTEVALKTVHLSQGTDLYQFKREFRTMADLAHPNLVRLHELISEDAQVFFTMEYVRGQPFDEYLLGRITPAVVEEGDPEPPPVPDLSQPGLHERVLRAIKQLCSGVHAMHGAGCIHRDLKPSNVLVTQEGRVVILDFGLARNTGSNTLSGHSLSGTPPYMAPEQALNTPAMPATDWYAVGTMIYEVLTGRCPFEGTVFEVLLRKQSEDPPHVCTVNPTADKDLGDLCMRLLARDPLARPAGIEVLSRLDVRPEKEHTPTPRPTPIGLPAQGLIGRGAEQQSLLRAFERSRKGELAAVVIQGTSGIGKTSLIEACLSDIRSQFSDGAGPLILRGRCHERETLPFKAFDGVVDSLSHRLDGLPREDLSYVLPDGILHLAEIFPVLRRIKLIENRRYYQPPLRDARELRNQAFVAFTSLLTRLVHLIPVVVFIDDLQWGDRDSFALLRALIKQPGAPNVMVLVNCRPTVDTGAGSVGAMVRELIAQPGVENIPLGPLDPSSIGNLAEDLLTAHGIDPVVRESIALQVASEAGGNPFFAVELVQHLLPELAADGGRAPSLEARDLQLDGMILKRVESLPDDSRRMLKLIAVAGDPLPQQALALAAGVPFGSDAWDKAITALLDERLVSRRGRQSGNLVEVYHDRIGEAVLALLDAAESRRAHTQLAEAIESCGRERTDLLARYWLSAQDPERAKRYALDAAAEARSKLAFDRAADLYETAISLETDRKAKFTLLRRLGDCRAADGHAVLAAEAYQQAANLSSAIEAVRLRHLAAEQLLRGGHISRGLEVLREVLRNAGLRMATGPKGAVVSITWQLLKLRLRGLKFKERAEAEIPDVDRRRLDILWSVNTGLGVVDTLRADDFLLRFLFLAFKTGSIRRIAQGLAILSGQLAALGRFFFRWSQVLAAEAEVLARRSSDQHTIGIARMSKAIVRYFMGEWDTAADDLTAVEKHFQEHCHGVSWELATTRSFTCFALRLGGRIRELSERFDRYTSDADRTGDRYLATNLRTYQSIVWLARDDLANARKEIVGTLDLWPKDLYQVQHFFHFYSRCEHALYADDPEEAYRIYLEEQPRIRASDLMKVRALQIEYAWISGRIGVNMAARTPPDVRGPILRMIEKSARTYRSGEHQTGDAIGAALHAAVIALTPGIGADAATQALDRAVATADASGSRLLAECGRRFLGERLGGRRGQEMRARSNAWMTDQGVKNPARFAHLYFPGFRKD